MKYSNYSIYNFEDLLQGNFLYVDKTEYIWQLIKPSQAMYFLSRPRRFGKSLTISTLKAVFEGKKELFKELAIYDKPYDWKPYPIIHLSFGDYNPVNNTSDKLNAYLQGKIMAIAQNLSVNLQPPTDPSDAFGKLVDKLSAKERVVILVDEYDKPILDNITNPNIKEIQKCLKGFYGIIIGIFGTDRRRGIFRNLSCGLLFLILAARICLLESLPMAACFRPGSACRESCKTHNGYKDRYYFCCRIFHSILTPLMVILSKGVSGNYVSEKA